MPRFYFHLVNDWGQCSDTHGMVLPDDEAAWYQAFRSARDLLGGSDGSAAMHIYVEDEAGRQIWSLPIEEIVDMAR
jgi:hypothetical protein